MTDWQRDDWARKQLRRRRLRMDPPDEPGGIAWPIVLVSLAVIALGLVLAIWF